jgi:hypothetical protein
MPLPALLLSLAEDDSGLDIVKLREILVQIGIAFILDAILTVRKCIAATEM